MRLPPVGKTQNSFSPVLGVIVLVHAIGVIGVAAAVAVVTVRQLR